jgi:hypothetical protein
MEVLHSDKIAHQSGFAIAFSVADGDLARLLQRPKRNLYFGPAVSNWVWHGERAARALDVPLYQIFYFGEESPSLPQPARSRSNLWGSSGKDARLLAQFCRTLRKTKETDRTLLLHVARKLAKGRAA